MTSGRFYYLGVVCAVEGSRTKHEVDGRAILAEFHSFRLLNTYVPNNGWKDEDMGFPRRRAWDQRMLEFVTRPSNKPLVWCGDLNVSHEDIDVSHPDFFRNAKLQGYTPPNPEVHRFPPLLIFSCSYLSRV
jgi:exonuclease III